MSPSSPEKKKKGKEKKKQVWRSPRKERRTNKVVSSVYLFLLLPLGEPIACLPSVRVEVNSFAPSAASVDRLPLLVARQSIANQTASLSAWLTEWY